MLSITVWLRPSSISAPPNATAERLDSQPVDRTELMDFLRTELASAYVDPWDFADLFESVGMDGVLNYLRDRHFPKDERTRKGNFGETLALVWVRDALGYEVPLVKRRWAMNREKSQHGEDVVGFIFADDDTDELILVEAKFYLDQVPSAIRRAHGTITKCMTASECYSLHAIMTFYHETSDRDRYNRVRRMFNDYAKAHFRKRASIFIVSKPSSWKDSYFEEHAHSNTIKDLLCVALVDSDIEYIYEECH